MEERRYNNGGLGGTMMEERRYNDGGKEVLHHCTEERRYNDGGKEVQ